MSSPTTTSPRPAPVIASAGTALLFATAPTDSGSPAAAMEFDGETLVTRLAGQLASLGITDVRIVVRPGSGLAGIESPDPAADLRLVAQVAREGTGVMVLAGGEIITQREALAGLLADPRLVTGILSTSGRIARPYGFRTKTKRGRLVSAASPFHTTADPNQTFLGVLKVGAPDRARLAACAERLAELRADPPESWTRELEFCKAGSWKLAVERIRRATEEREARLAAEAAGITRDPEADHDPEAADAAAAEIERQDPESVDLQPEDAAELRRRMAAAPQEIPALLLTALVRDGTQIGNSFLRSLFWARPLCEADVAVARERIGDYDEERELLRSAVKASDGFFTTFFVSPLSKYVARFCARLGLNPNQVTVFSMLIGVAAAALFATGEKSGYVAGAVLAYFAFFFDCVDGQLARYTRTFSKLGAWLDSIFDRSKEYVLFAGLAIGATESGDPAWVLACAAIVLQTTRHSVDFSYPVMHHVAIDSVTHAPIEQPGDGFGLNTPLWLRPPPLPKDQRPEPPPPTPFQRVWRLWRRVGRLPGVKWLKKMITFPIGERFAVIALVTALAGPRTTFHVLLAWGGFAATYIVLGRLLRVLRSDTAVAPPGSVRGRLEAYRDDGLLALLGILGSRTVHRGRFRWLIPPALRVIELGGIAFIADRAGAPEAGYALIAAICFRHYDLVYRLRHRGTEADRVVSALGLGWAGRLLLAAGLAAIDPQLLYVAAALGLALWVGDAVRAWRGAARVREEEMFTDEEEEAG